MIIQCIKNNCSMSKSCGYYYGVNYDHWDFINNPVPKFVMETCINGKSKEWWCRKDHRKPRKNCNAIFILKEE